MPSALAPIAGAVVGGLMGGSDSGGQTATKAPWDPAQPFLKDLINQGQSLYGNNQQNPFNQLQQTAYQNQFSQLDNFNNNLVPGIAKGLQGLLGNGYDLSSLLTPQATRQGLLANAPSEVNGKQAQYAPSSFGLLNFTQLNPYANGQIDASKVGKKSQEEIDAEERDRMIRENYDLARIMDYRSAGA